MISSSFFRSSRSRQTVFAEISFPEDPVTPDDEYITISPSQKYTAILSPSEEYMPFDTFRDFISLTVTLLTSSSTDRCRRSFIFCFTWSGYNKSSTIPFCFNCLAFWRLIIPSAYALRLAILMLRDFDTSLRRLFQIPPI